MFTWRRGSTARNRPSTIVATDDPAPEHGALDALAYDGPWDPVSGSSDVRGLPCRVERSGCDRLQLAPLTPKRAVLASIPR